MRPDCGWGELSELRVSDLDFGSRMLTVSRAVVQLQPRFHPTGGRFLVKDYPKDRESRRFKLSAQITAKLRAHMVEHDLGRETCYSEPLKRTGRGSGSCGSWSIRTRSGGPSRTRLGEATGTAR